MKVIVLGATGRLGSRILPALIVHGHQAVAFVRNPSKIPPVVLQQLAGVVTGDASSKEDIARAIVDNDCDGVVNTAGFAATAPWKRTDFLKIFAAAVNASVEVGRQRGKPLRAWFLGGFGMLDTLDPRYMMIDYIHVKPEHRINLELLLNQQKSDLAWSYLCPAVMRPLASAAAFPPDKQSTGNLIASAKTPPGWADGFSTVPVIGTYLNVLSQIALYTTTLEENADFIAQDLEMGMNSQWLFSKVGVRQKHRIPPM